MSSGGVPTGPIDPGLAREAAQIAEQNRLTAITEENCDDFAGLSSAGAARAVLYVVGNLPAAAARARELADEAAERGVQVEVAVRSRSLRHLTEVRDSIMGNRAFGTGGRCYGYEVEIDPARNQVILRVPEADLDAATLTAHAYYGTAVVVLPKEFEEWQQ